MLKKITLVTGNTVDYTCLHIQRKIDTDGSIRTLCGRNIPPRVLKPAKEHAYDSYNARQKKTLRELRPILLSNCNQCLRLETGLAYKRMPAQ